MRAEMVEDCIERELEQAEKAEMKKKSVCDQQHKHRTLQKKLNLKSTKPKQTVNDVSIYSVILSLVCLPESGGSAIFKHHANQHC